MNRTPTPCAGCKAFISKCVHFIERLKALTYQSPRMIAASTSLRHFSVDNFFYTDEHPRTQETAMACKHWHTITHLTIFSARACTPLLIDLLAAGTVTHLTYAERVSDYAEWDRLDQETFLEVRAALCAHAGNLVEFSFTHDHCRTPIPREWIELDPVIALLASCKHLTVYAKHVKSLQAFNLPEIQHITILELFQSEFLSPSGEVEALVEKHAGTLKTIRVTNYSYGNTFVREDSEERKWLDDLYSRSGESGIEFVFEQPSSPRDSSGSMESSNGGSDC